MRPHSLSYEEHWLLERAKAQGYLTVDLRDPEDGLATAYQYWCVTTARPFLKLALGDATSHVTFSLLEASARFPIAMEAELRTRLPQYSLSIADIIVEDDYCIAPRVLNEFLPEVLQWLRQLAAEAK